MAGLGRTKRGGMHGAFKKSRTSGKNAIINYSETGNFEIVPWGQSAAGTKSAIEKESAYRQRNSW